MSLDARETVQWLEHDADVLLEVRAASPDRLFALAAEALVSLLADGERPAAPERRGVRLESGDLEMLLVAWLNEVIYLATRGVFFPVSVLSVALSGASVDAELAGVGPGAAFPRLVREVKAATFHGLAITEDAGTWRCAIVFDV